MNNQINIVYWNLQGISKKIHKLINFAQQNKIHTILFNEIVLAASTTIKFLNYQIYCNDKIATNGNNGPLLLLYHDTAVLISNNLIHHEVHIKTILVDNTTIHVIINNIKTKVLSIHKSPQNNLLIPELDIY